MSLPGHQACLPQSQLPQRKESLRILSYVPLLFGRAPPIDLVAVKRCLFSPIPFEHRPSFQLLSSL